MKWEIKWIDAQKHLPPKSGRYLTLKLYENSEPYITTYNYSDKFKKFNVRDDSISDETAVDVDFWAEAPLVIL